MIQNRYKYVLKNNEGSDSPYILSSYFEAVVRLVRQDRPAKKQR